MKGDKASAVTRGLHSDWHFPGFRRRYEQLEAVAII